MLKIAMDTAGDLPNGWAKDYDIDLIPINLIHSGQSFLQGVDLKYDDFYQLVEEKGIIPTTSQPTPYQFVEFYKQIAQPGDDILSIHVTDKLSGTMSSARQAAEELKGEYNIIPYDSASGTICMGMMCKEAREMERKGKSIGQILTRLDTIRRKMNLIFTVDTLKYAKLSGRVKSLQASLASLLDLKPLIELNQGTIDTVAKVRTRKASLTAMVKRLKNKLGDQPVRIAIVHANDPQTGGFVKKLVEETFNCLEVAYAEISISLAAHFGPGTIGLAAYPD